MLNNPMQRLLVALAGGVAVLVATIATVALAATTVSAVNSHHDSTATSGRLEKGCRTFELTGTTLTTKCNKVGTAGIIKEFQSSTDIHSDIDLDQQCNQWVYIKPKSDGVEIGYKCKGTGTLIADLNDVVWWEPSTGQTHVK